MLTLDKALDTVLSEVYAMTLQALLEVGISQNSDVVKSVEVKPEDGGIEVRINDYVKYIDSGRRPLAKRVPFKDLLNWVKRKNIRFPGKTDREMAYMIQTSIYRKGIRPRKFLDSLQKDIQRVTGQLIETQVLEQIAQRYEQLF